MFYGSPLDNDVEKKKKLYHVISFLQTRPLLVYKPNIVKSRGFLPTTNLIRAH